ncbi:MAG: RNase adapter RapZ [Acidimicrobiales bacterium]
MSLLPKVAELASAGGAYDKVALVMAAAGEDLAREIGHLRTELHDVRVVFLEASTDVLVRRFESTKRRHPFAHGARRETDPGTAGDAALVSADEGGTLIDSIQAEREQLMAARSLADLVIDTSSLSPHQLRARLASQFSDSTTTNGLHLTVSSFGFKHGVPLDVDMVIDCRFLPNPYWDEALRPLRGTDPSIQAFVFADDRAQAFLDKLEALLDELLPAYADEGRSYLNIAFGCTGGHHRSVAVAEHIAAVLKDRGWMPRVKHRDVER